MPYKNGLKLRDRKRKEHRKAIARRLLNTDRDFFDPESGLVNGMAQEVRDVLDDYLVNRNLRGAVKRHCKHRSSASISKKAELIAKDVVSQAYLNRALGAEGLLPDTLDVAREQLRATKTVFVDGEPVEVPDNAGRQKMVKTLLDIQLKSTESLRKARLLEPEQQSQIIDVAAQMVDEFSLEQLEYMAKNKGELPPANLDPGA